METSIIIRTKNEEKWLGVTLEKLKQQTYQNFEIILVDSGSKDKTLEIAKKYSVKIISIPAEKFTYPYALNLGCHQVLAEKFLVFLSAHSVPISVTWLADGISDFKNEKVAGVYGGVWALPDGTIWEKLLFNVWLGKIEVFLKHKKEVKKVKMGVLGFTSAIIRKNLYDQYNFNEAYAGGGEDAEWARYWLKKGYYFIYDPRFSVYHSHSLGLKGLWKQYQHWKKVLKGPQSFQRLDYRQKKIKN